MLAGGVANEGRVVRIGSRVHRPAGPHAQSIHAYLRSLNELGFDGASVPEGFDEMGREVLTFLDGVVPAPPYPDWAQGDSALVSIAALIARMHVASVAFDPSGHAWSSELADPRGGPVLCHNDVCLENVVFRDGAAVGLIDFDYAAPGRAVYDLAQFAKMCVPLDHPANIAKLGWNNPDQAGRLRAIADAYRLAARERSELLAAIDDAMTSGAAFVERHFRAGEPGFVAMVERNGGLGRWENQQRWWRDHISEFETALSVSTSVPPPGGFFERSGGRGEEPVVECPPG